MSRCDVIMKGLTQTNNHFVTFIDSHLHFRFALSLLLSAHEGFAQTAHSFDSLPFLCYISLSNILSFGTSGRVIKKVQRESD